MKIFIVTTAAGYTFIAPETVCPNVGDDYLHQQVVRCDDGCLDIDAIADTIVSVTELS
jgi:hypothetical protein